MSAYTVGQMAELLELASPKFSAAYYARQIRDGLRPIFSQMPASVGPVARRPRSSNLITLWRRGFTAC